MDYVPAYFFVLRLSSLITHQWNEYTDTACETNGGCVRTSFWQWVPLETTLKVVTVSLKAPLWFNYCDTGEWVYLSIQQTVINQNSRNHQIGRELTSACIINTWLSVPPWTLGRVSGLRKRFVVIYSIKPPLHNFFCKYFSFAFGQLYLFNLSKCCLSTLSFVIPSSLASFMLIFCHLCGYFTVHKPLFFTNKGAL